MKVRDFRTSRRKVIPDEYNGWVHLTALMLSCIITISTLLQFIQFGLFECLAIPFSFLLANFVEYIGHRWPMHRKVFGTARLSKKHSGIHHRFFTEEYMFADYPKDFREILTSKITLLAFIFLAALPLFFIVWSIANLSIASTCLATFTLYYFCYEILHVSFHSKKMKNFPIIKQLKRTHIVHHNTKLMREYNFNIFLPVFDFVFRTYI